MSYCKKTVFLIATTSIDGFYRQTQFRFYRYCQSVLAYSLFSLPCCTVFFFFFLRSNVFIRFVDIRFSKYWHDMIRSIVLRICSIRYETHSLVHYDVWRSLDRKWMYEKCHGWACLQTIRSDFAPIEMEHIANETDRRYLWRRSRKSLNSEQFRTIPNTFQLNDELKAVFKILYGIFQHFGLCAI